MYYSIICNNCIECKGKDIQTNIIKSNDNNNSDITITKCKNYEYNGIYLLSERV